MPVQIGELKLSLQVNMKTRTGFGSMDGLKLGGSGSSDLLLGTRSRTGRWELPLSLCHQLTIVDY